MERDSAWRVWIHAVFVFGSGRAWFDDHCLFELSAVGQSEQVNFWSSGEKPPRDGNLVWAHEGPYTKLLMSIDHRSNARLL